MKNALIILAIIAISEASSRQKRFLLFPRGAPTRLQFVTGFGIPLPLEKESITAGYVLRTQYFLPYNVTQFYPDFAGTNPITKASLAAGMPLVKRSIAEEETDKDESRWIFYKSLEGILASRNFEGKSCLLRAICEHGSGSQFGFFSGILGEVLHILMTPSTSSVEVEGNEYLAAERAGNDGEPCSFLYNECNTSILDFFSQFW